MRIDLWNKDWLEQENGKWILHYANGTTKPVSELPENWQLVCKTAIKATLVSPKPWAVGYHDRGMGHGSFAVVDANNDVVCEGISRKDAEYIVELVNKEQV